MGMIVWIQLLGLSAQQLTPAHRYLVYPELLSVYRLPFPVTFFLHVDSGKRLWILAFAFSRHFLPSRGFKAPDSRRFGGETSGGFRLSADVQLPRCWRANLNPFLVLSMQM